MEETKLSKYRAKRDSPRPTNRAVGQKLVSPTDGVTLIALQNTGSLGLGDQAMDFLVADAALPLACLYIF